MSLCRKIVRARCRKNGIEIEARPPRFEMLPGGGYKVLHPTKGWRRVSPKRVRFYR